MTDHTEILETVKLKQVEIANQLENDRTNLGKYQADIHERLTTMQDILDELHDDLKLRKWLMRATKSVILILAAVFGFLHAPAWFHHLFGIEVIKK